MKNNLIIAVIIALIIGATGGFFAGMRYRQLGQVERFGNFQGGRNSVFGPFGNAQGKQGLRPVAGEIISSDDKSITVKLMDGSSKIVLLTDTTSINKSAQGAKSDLKTGERVAVFGQVNSDGSVTAQNVQLNPMMRGFMGTPSASPGK